MKNLPDDWTAFYKTCSKCGYRFHSSEHACPKCIQSFENEHLKEILNKILHPERND